MSLSLTLSSALVMALTLSLNLALPLSDSLSEPNECRNTGIAQRRCLVDRGVCTDLDDALLQPASPAATTLQELPRTSWRLDRLIA